MKKNHRLYIFTGKGGVGKTTLSKSFARFLISQGIKSVYVTFQHHSLGSEHRGTTDNYRQGLREISLDLEESAQHYIEKKLNSKVIAKWIVKTPFFRALINMVPGFSYLIYLGKILQMQVDDPSMVVILDAPASGHALTMIESTSNFGDIFGSGMIFEDTKKMLGLLNDPLYTKIHVISLPSSMSWQEATELKHGLQERTPVEVQITMNNALYPVLEKHLGNLPPGLKEKALNEKKLIDEHHSEMLCILPHSISTDNFSIESDLVGSLSKLM